MKEASTHPEVQTVPEGIATQQDAVPVYRSNDLLQGKKELFILHGNEVYHLIRTRNDKLILQK